MGQETITFDISVPAVPVPVLTPLENGRVRIETGTVNGAQGFKVYRGGAEVVDIAETEYIDTGLTPNTGYTYRVEAYNTLGTSTSPDFTVTTLASIPDNLQTTNILTDSLTLVWGANGNPPGTEYFARCAETGEETGWITDTQAIFTGLDIVNMYTFEVKVRNSDNVETVYTSIQGTTGSPPVTGGVVISPGEDPDTVKIEVPAGIPPGAVGFEYIVQPGPFVPYPVLGDVFGGTPFTPPLSVPVQPGDYIGVAAVDAEGKVVQFAEAQVTAGDISSLDSITAAPNPVSLAKGLMQQLTITANYTGGSAIDVSSAAAYTVDDPAIISVDAAGLVTALDQGNAAITVDYNTKQSIVPVTVSEAIVLGLQITPDSAADTSITVGNQKQFTATMTYSDGTVEDVTGLAVWSVTNESIAGSVIISAAHSAEIAMLGISIVSPPAPPPPPPPPPPAEPEPVGITISPSGTTVYEGESKQFSATLKYSDGTMEDVTGAAEWTVAVPSLAAVNMGLAHALADGTTEITAAYEGFNATAAFTVVGITGLTLSPSGATVYEGESKHFSATLNYSDGTTEDVTKAAEWTVTAPAVVSIAEGLAKGLSDGSTEITAIYEGISSTASLTVVGISGFTVSPSSAVIKEGDTKQLTATLNYTDGSVIYVTHSARWTTDNAEVATVEIGVVTAQKEGSAKVRAEYQDMVGEAVITVEKIAPPEPRPVSLLVTPDTATVEVGESRQFVATLSYDDGSMEDVTGLAEWLSGDILIASVNTGSVMGLAEGAVTISARWNGLSGSASLNVKKSEGSGGGGNGGGGGSGGGGSRDDDITPPVNPPVPLEPEPPQPEILQPEIPEVQVPQPVIPEEPEHPDHKTGDDNGKRNDDASESELDLESMKQDIQQIILTQPKSEIVTGKGVIYGRVLDIDNQPISGLVVELHSAVRTTITDKNGYYRFENVEVGQHHIYLKENSIELAQVALVVQPGINRIENVFGNKKAQVQTNGEEVNFIVSLDKKAVPVLLKDEQVAEPSSGKDLLENTTKVTLGTAGGAGGIYLFVWAIKRRKNVIVYTVDGQILARYNYKPDKSILLNIKEYIESGGKNLKVVFTNRLVKKLEVNSTITLLYGDVDLGTTTICERLKKITAEINPNTLSVKWNKSV
jgi:uncharacterized membrane protein YgcG